MEDITYVDADGHILEPSNLWERNLESRYQDRPMKFGRDSDGLETWFVDGKPHDFLANGTSANMATFGKSIKWREDNVFNKHSFSWDQGREANPGACDPIARTKFMDEERIDKSILFPSLGLDWPGSVKDPGLMAAYCRVYNDWIIDFCSQAPSRLYPTILLPWIDIDETVTEMKRHLNSGPRSIMCPNVPLNDISYGDIHWDRVWQEFVDEDIPVSLHVSSGGTRANGIRSPGIKTPNWWSFSTGPADTLLNFATFFQGCVFDRFPDIKVVVLESGTLWMPFILDRMDEKFEILAFTTKMDLKPSEYFQRQCWISMDPDDEFGPFVIERLGADKLVWAYDYPHSDSPTEPVKNLERLLGELPEEDMRKVVGQNTIDLYKL